MSDQLTHYTPKVILLRRTVRVCINPRESRDPTIPGYNTFAAYPSMQGLGRFYELEVACRGDVDEKSGYFLNIKVIDRAVRDLAVPILERACDTHPGSSPEPVLFEMFEAVNASLGATVQTLRWRLTPYFSFEMEASMPGHVLMRQQFDFAASHRLHSRHFSDEDNRKLFGKCNNPSGHGHNYRIEPCVRVGLGGSGSPPSSRFTLADLERVTSSTVIDRFDHMYLNVDTAEFRDAASGVTPSVENIAEVCHRLLAPAIAAMNKEAALVSVTVWETDKTSATYPG